MTMYGFKEYSDEYEEYSDESGSVEDFKCNNNDNFYIRSLEQFSKSTSLSTLSNLTNNTCM